MRQLKINKSITSRTDAAMNRFMKDVAREEMITAEEEAELAMMIQRNDESSQAVVDKLVRANLRFVISVAKQYQRPLRTQPHRPYQTVQLSKITSYRADKLASSGSSPTLWKIQDTGIPRIDGAQHTTETKW